MCGPFDAFKRDFVSARDWSEPRMHTRGSGSGRGVFT